MITNSKLFNHQGYRLVSGGPEFYCGSSATQRCALIGYEDSDISALSKDINNQPSINLRRAYYMLSKVLPVSNGRLLTVLKNGISEGKQAAGLDYRKCTVISTYTIYMIYSAYQLL